MESINEIQYVESRVFNYTPSDGKTLHITEHYILECHNLEIIVRDVHTLKFITYIDFRAIIPRCREINYIFTMENFVIICGNRDDEVIAFNITKNTFKRLKDPLLHDSHNRMIVRNLAESYMPVNFYYINNPPLDIETPGNMDLRDYYEILCSHFDVLRIYVKDNQLIIYSDARNFGEITRIWDITPDGFIFRGRIIHLFHDDIYYTSPDNAGILPFNHYGRWYEKKQSNYTYYRKFGIILHYVSDYIPDFKLNFNDKIDISNTSIRFSRNCPMDTFMFWYNNPSQKNEPITNDDIINIPLVPLEIIQSYIILKPYHFDIFFI